MIPVNPEIVKVRYKGQITIPQLFREIININEGDYLSCEKNGIIFQFAGSVKTRGEQKNTLALEIKNINLKKRCWSL